MGRRANGEGSVYRRASGRWDAEKTVLVDGRPTRRTATGKTRREAIEKLNRIPDEITTVGDLGTDPTFAEWCCYWLTELVSSDGTATSTKAHKYRIAKTYLVPLIGHIPLRQLHHRDVTSMIRALQDPRRGLSDQTVRTTVKVLRTCLNVAVRLEIIDKNYAAPVFVPLKRERKVDNVSMSRTEARRLLEHVDRQPDLAMRAIVHLLVSRGLRRAEVLGLSWGDLDMDSGNLVIRRTLNRVPRADRLTDVTSDDPLTGGRLALDAVKTRKSARTVLVPSETLQVLREWRAEWERLRDRFVVGHDGVRRFGGSWEDADLMFVTAIGTPMEPQNVYHRFQRITVAAGLGKWTVHQMRHTCASLLIQAGVPVKEISDMLGHESVNITLDIYGHLFPESRSVTADAASEVLYR